MQDHGDYTDRTLSPADTAVKYALDRMQRDPDLRYRLVGTQLFALLCEAEAARLGEYVEDVRERRLLDLSTPNDRLDFARRQALAEAGPELLEAAERLLTHLNDGLGKPVGSYQHACRDLREAVESARPQG